MKTYQILFTCLLIITCQSCKDQQKVEIDLASASNEIELLSKGIISTGLYERDIAITPDGTEMIYTLGDYKQTKRCLVQLKKVNDKWGEAEILNISGEHQDIEPFYADNGERLFFASNRPMTNDSTRTDYNIWYSDRSKEGWASPMALNEKINTEGDEFYPSVSNNGNLYFTASREDGIGREDIFVSKKVDGNYQKPEVLDSAINTSVYEFNAYINPDENLLIFSSYGRADDLGGGDLYFSTKRKNGLWNASINMGHKVNSNKLDYCPFIDVARNNFYFTSERSKSELGKLENLESLKEYSNSAQNGMGDIYRIGIDQLDLKSK